MANRWLLSLSLLLAALVFSTGCAHHKYFTFNLRHSCSLAVLEKDWPGKKADKLSPAQKEIFEKRGAPDFLRFWWSDSDDFPTDVNPQYLTAEQIAGTKQSWVYARQGDEVIFESAFSSHSVPISDKLAIVIKEGDPETRQVTQDKDTGKTEEVWHYPSSGKEYRFLGDTLFDTRQVNDPMGSAFLKN